MFSYIINNDDTIISCQNVKVKYDETGVPVTGASAFMTYHTVMRTSQQFHEALRVARSIADNITRTLNLVEKDGKMVPGDTRYEVFPYRSASHISMSIYCRCMNLKLNCLPPNLVEN